MSPNGGFPCSLIIFISFGVRPSAISYAFNVSDQCLIWIAFVSPYQEAPLYPKLYPHESVYVIYPESCSYHFKRNRTARYVFQPAQG